MLGQNSCGQNRGGQNSMGLNGCQDRTAAGQNSLSSK